MKLFKNDEMTDYRLTITVNKDYYKLVEDLLTYIDENIIYSHFDGTTSEQLHEVFNVEKGAIYKSQYYRELKANEYQVSLGEPKEVDNA
tara:strand:- start:327 stop:593 length:267 start_codon:yes stop_codon:yes gene_type:complete